MIIFFGETTYKKYCNIIKYNIDYRHYMSCDQDCSFVTSRLGVHLKGRLDSPMFSLCSPLAALHGLYTAPQKCFKNLNCAGRPVYTMLCIGYTGC